MSSGPALKLRSWNVNGIRACARKGMFDWMQEHQPDILGIQEVRALEEQLDDEQYKPQGWERSMCPAERKGYSGVAFYCKNAPERVETALGESRFDCEGRVQIAYWGALAVANVYFPNGKGKERDNSRVPYKLDFYRALFQRLQTDREAGKRVVVMGDFNTAHRDIDLARPKANRKISGFLPEECEELDRWLDAGWTDSFRHYHPEPDRYSWWSQRAGARERNVGWRIDYVYCCPEAMKFVRKAEIFDQVLGSDHCPIGVDLDPEILRE